MASSFAKARLLLLVLAIISLLSYAKSQNGQQSTDDPHFQSSADNTQVNNKATESSLQPISSEDVRLIRLKLLGPEHQDHASHQSQHQQYQTPPNTHQSQVVQQQQQVSLSKQTINPQTMSQQPSINSHQNQQQPEQSGQPRPQATLMDYQSPVAMKQQPVVEPSRITATPAPQHPPPPPTNQQLPLNSYSSGAPNYQSAAFAAAIHPLYLGHNPFIEILRPLSYADDNIVTLNLSHSHIYEIDSDAFVGQRFEQIDLSNNKLGLIHSRSFRIGPNHSRHNPYNPHSNNSKQATSATYPTRRPPPTHPQSVIIDFSHNPAIVALSGAFDHIDVPNCLLNFTNSTVELKFGAFKKYFKEHPGHIIEIDSVDCCEQEWLLGYKHNFVSRTYCVHDPSLLLSKVPQQTIIESCIVYVTSARHSMTIQGPSKIQVAAAPRYHHSNSHSDNQYLTYLILGGTAMILTSLSIYIIFYMFSLKAAFVCQMQHKS